METPSGNIFRSVGFWLRMPVVGPILCLLLVWVILATSPNVVDMVVGVFLRLLFVVGCITVGGNVTRAGRYLLRR